MSFACLSACRSNFRIATGQNRKTNSQANQLHQNYRNSRETDKQIQATDNRFQDRELAIKLISIVVFHTITVAFILTKRQKDNFITNTETLRILYHNLYDNINNDCLFYTGRN